METDEIVNSNTPMQQTTLEVTETAVVQSNEASLQEEQEKAIDRARLEFEQNHNKIESCIQELVIDRQKPTVNEIARKTKLSRPTIYKHLETINICELDNDIDFRMAKTMRGNVLMGILQGAMRGNPNSVRMYAKIMGLVDRQPGKKSNKININNSQLQYNNYQITPEMLKKLPVAKQAELEEILNDLTK